MLDLLRSSRGQVGQSSAVAARIDHCANPLPFDSDTRTSSTMFKMYSSYRYENDLESRDTISYVSSADVSWT